MNRMRVMNFPVTNNVSIHVVIMLIQAVHFCNYSLAPWGIIYHKSNGRNCTFQIVGATRGNPDGFGNASGSGSQQPPPPPPGFAEVLVAQTELLSQLVQGQQLHQQQSGHNGHQPQAASYLDFLETQPPLFHQTNEPLDADAWIRSIKSKFSVLVVPCSDANKARFAAQQLRGTAHLWWDHYNDMLPVDHIVTYDEFKNAFRAHHLPEGLMERKLNEFLGLTQGTSTVLQYAQAFNNLCHYAGYHADTDAKKRDHFRRGLNTKLKDHLNPIKVDTYSELVNLAITQEDCIIAHRAEKKRKTPTGPSSASPLRYRLVQTATPQAPQQGRCVFRPPQQQEISNPPVPQQT